MRCSTIVLLPESKAKTRGRIDLRECHHQLDDRSRDPDRQAESRHSQDLCLFYQSSEQTVPEFRLTGVEANSVVKRAVEYYTIPCTKKIGDLKMLVC